MSITDLRLSFSKRNTLKKIFQLIFFIISDLKLLAKLKRLHFTLFQNATLVASMKTQMFKFLLCENLNLGTIRCPRNKVQYCIFFISKISNFHVFNVCKESFITDFSQRSEYVPELSRKEIFFFFLAKVNSILISTKSRPRRLKCGLYNYSYKIK